MSNIPYNKSLLRYMKYDTGTKTLINIQLALEEQLPVHFFITAFYAKIYF